MNLVKVGEHIIREIDGEFLLLPIKSNVSHIKRIYRMNETGVQIWENINGKRTKDEVINIIVNEYNKIESEKIYKDTSDYIDNLVSEDIIRYG